jgi:hypothetical protein
MEEENTNTIPLNYIYHGGNGNLNISKCQNILDNYGVPIGYSCVYQQISYDTTLPPAGEIRTRDLGQTIPDELFDQLFDKANAAAASPRAQRAQRTHITKRRAQPPQRPRKSKKKRSPAAAMNT